MSLEIFEPNDFPLAIPHEDNEPVQWTPEAIAKLAALPADELNRHVVQMLAWYVREDETNLGQEGNEYWAAGHYMAKAVVQACAQKTGETFSTTPR